MMAYGMAELQKCCEGRSASGQVIVIPAQVGIICILRGPTQVLLIKSELCGNIRTPLKPLVKALGYAGEDVSTCSKADVLCSPALP